MLESRSARPEISIHLLACPNKTPSIAPHHDLSSLAKVNLAEQRRQRVHLICEFANNFATNLEACAEEIPRSPSGTPRHT